MFAERTQREDIVHFLNACYACTGQREFYENADSQRVSIDFLHQYVLGNYRAIYARSLAVGINHFNQAQVILRLLASGKDAVPNEGALIARALATMPPHRAWKTLRDARRLGINNRRARAVARDYLRGRDATFDCVKYRNKVKAVACHNHLSLPGEAGRFLFEKRAAVFQTPLFEQVRRAWHSTEAVYELPFTVAEGLAAKHGVPRAQFLAKIQPRMTQAERLRMQKAGDVEIDLGRSPLTKLVLYALSLPEPPEDVLSAIQQATARLLCRTPLALGRVAAVLDNSYSTSGTREKRRRPLGVAWAVDRVLAAASREYRAFWTHPFAGAKPEARGATDLSTPILDALETAPELLVIVSDAVENDPPGGASAVLKYWQAQLDPKGRVTIVHFNPVFSASDYAPRAMAEGVPTVGLRDAESLPTALAFARFATGSATRADLEAFLDRRAQEFLAPGAEAGHVE
ncbi:Alr2131 protein OS=Nostoc sp. (strain PCC 7120 / UTEX 2576) GN=alr2131 PE=4 SV=1 [Gemmata massiliana]|uniref:Alr2131 protein n=1 Tax=Gemmata massiliana TaxID=1210884 RepID=A0A6P2DAS4_9BACT|nr:hypothetical protein [Gemmata massiliana]VTR98043.1 Alr2131 protein OS=Nostoc sp. (strain PCC 7120 / UTEX 2576) GN=alr2131 PE=4 SV=1 [Gemmata massiliana]